MRFGPTAHSWQNIWKPNLLAFANLKGTPQQMPFSNSLHPSMNPTPRNSASMHPHGYKTITNPLKLKSHEKVLQRPAPHHSPLHRQMCRMWHNPQKRLSSLLLAFRWKTLLPILRWIWVPSVSLCSSWWRSLPGHRKSLRLLIFGITFTLPGSPGLFFL